MALTECCVEGSGESTGGERSRPEGPTGLTDGPAPHRAPARAPPLTLRAPTPASSAAIPHPSTRADTPPPRRPTQQSATGRSCHRRGTPRSGVDTGRHGRASVAGLVGLSPSPCLRHFRTHRLAPAPCGGAPLPAACNASGKGDGERLGSCDRLGETASGFDRGAAARSAAGAAAAIAIHTQQSLPRRHVASSVRSGCQGLNCEGQTG